MIAVGLHMSRRKDNQKAVIFGLMGSKMTHASVLVVSFRVRESVDLGKPEEGESLDLEKVRKTASTAYRKLERSVGDST